MYYDLYLKQSYDSFDDMAGVKIKGFAIVDYEKQCASGSIYSRINVSYSNKLDQAMMAKLRLKYDIICVLADSIQSLQSIGKLGADIVQIELEALKHAKKTLPGFIQDKDIFLELVVSDALYGQRILWMNILRKLLKLGCKRNIILSSGAEHYTELRGENDLAKMLAVFGISEDNAYRILDNSRKVLRNAALRRYSSNGVIANSVPEGALKRDFIINYQEKAFPKK
ncbi:ribonuclease P/MRP protein subunit RPP1 [Enteropsectra breve]|nr:ribonuclease P/MRP protein subunit RPP1 [Enteropsectra breve]KAI5150804.1 ribonuclease P/MRP protein subunit RPP1 [Enteropsectra breve]